MGRIRSALLVGIAVIAGGFAGHDVYRDRRADGGVGRSAAVAVELGSVAPYRFLTANDGVPATWTCGEPIEVAVRLGTADASVLDDLDAALSAVSAASGYDLVSVGATDVVPDRDFDRWRAGRVAADVVVAFVDRGESDLLGAHAAANGGGDWQLVDGVARYTSGSVVVATDALASFAPGSGFVSLQGLFIHELLHVMNLAHVADAGSIMTPDLRDSYGSIGVGDLAGLSHLRSIACAR